MLMDLIDRLDEAIGAGANAAALRSQLNVIREQAEAIEARLKSVEARIQELEAKAQNQKLAPQQNRLEEGAEKILKLLFESDSVSVFVKEMARTLGMHEGVAKYHCDVLYEAEMIHFGGSVNCYYLLPEGRAYVVKFLLPRG